MSKVSILLTLSYRVPDLVLLAREPTERDMDYLPREIASVRFGSRIHTIKDTTSKLSFPFLSSVSPYPNSSSSSSSQ